MLTLALLAAAALAQEPGAGGCPTGSYEVGTRQEDTGSEIITHHICQAYAHSGNGLVGGTSWKVGYYAPKDASPELKARALEMLKEQQGLAGTNYQRAINFDKYNFVIGIAASTDIMRDLATRVIFEQLRNGQFSAGPDYQSAYNSLKGRSFDELGCHSNGAMVCLAALENGDIEAGNVTLYGPQVTTESLALWNQLVEAGKIKSLKIVINKNDPVPPVSLLSSPTNNPDVAAVMAAPLFFSVSAMAGAVKSLAPDAKVETFACGTTPSLKCHDMAVYASHEDRPRTSSGKSVPGTRLRGKSVKEPPPPPR
jgi:hypothetical protein